MLILIHVLQHKCYHIKRIHSSFISAIFTIQLFCSFHFHTCFMLVLSLTLTFYRISLLLAALVVVLVNSDPVDIFIQQIKASGKTYLKYKLTAKCEFRDAVPDTPPEGVRFQIQLDTPSTKFSVSKT